MYTFKCAFKIRSPAFGDNLFSQVADHKIFIPPEIMVIIFEVHLSPKMLLIRSSFLPLTSIHFDDVEYIMNSILLLIRPILFYLSELCTLVHSL